VKVCIFPFYLFTRLQIGYTTASVEVRIAVEYFDPSPASQKKRYAFKCHGQNISEVDHVWPVNSLAFHPTTLLLRMRRCRSGTIRSRNDFRQYPKFPEDVAAVASNCDGSRIAVGVSSTWDEGEAGFKANPV
jgi:cell cycle arrest protein BUB3